MTIRFLLILLAFFAALPLPAAAQPPGTATFSPFSAAPRPARPAVQQQPAPPAPLEEFRYAELSPRQRDLIIARILSRKGHYPEALLLYRDLLDEYPGDEEILGYYIETQVNNGDLEAAESLLSAQLGRTPDNRLFLALKARVHFERREYEEAYPIYEKLLADFPDDTGVRSDYAFASQSAGDWRRALTLYNEVLEADPDNESALEAVHEIQRERRPRLEINPSVRDEQAATTVSATALRYFSYAGNRLFIEADYTNAFIDRDSGPDRDSISQSLNDLLVTLGYDLSNELTVRVGGGVFTGLGDGFSQTVGLEWRLPPGGRIRAEGERNRPWYDPVEAADNEGHYDRAAFFYEGFFGNKWGLTLGLEYWNYTLDDGSDYGRKKTATASLSRRLLATPDLFLTYTYYRAMFDYEDDDFRPVDILEDEEINSLGLFAEHRFCRYLRLRLGGGYAKDTFKNSGNWFLGAGLTQRLGNRVELDAGFQYESDTNSAGGGETKTYDLNLKVVF